VVIGRFTAVARVLVPGLSGMADLRYRRFLVANAIGAILWGGGFTVRVWMWTAAFARVLVVGLCSIYLAIAHSSDVVGGAAPGAAWLAFCATGWRTWERLNRTRVHRSPPWCRSLPGPCLVPAWSHPGERPYLEKVSRNRVHSGVTILSVPVASSRGTPMTSFPRSADIFPQSPSATRSAAL
jgi:hypothetical protein